MTWIEIQKKYPNQWVGLTNVKWKDRSNVATADVKYTEKDMFSDEMILLTVQKKLDTAVYTTIGNDNSVEH